MHILKEKKAVKSGSGQIIEWFNELTIQRINYY